MLASVSSTYSDILTSVFSSTIAAKAWLASVAVLLGVVQVSTGARIFGNCRVCLHKVRQFYNSLLVAGLHKICSVLQILF